MNMTWLILIFSFTSLSSCVHIQAPQLNNVLGIFQEKTDPLSDYKWLLTIGDYQTHVYFFKVKGQTFFANENKDIIYIKNNSINALTIRDIDQATITLKDDYDESNNLIRRVYVDKSLYETQICQPWTKSNLNVKKQICQGASINQTIVQFDNEKWGYLKQYIPYLNLHIRLKKI